MIYFPILYFNLCCGRFSKLVFLSRDIGSSREVAQPIIRLAVVVATAVTHFSSTQTPPSCDILGCLE